MSIEKYASAISRSYWILLGLCGLAIVVSTGYDEAKPYREAIRELRSISSKSLTADGVDGQIRERILASIALPLAKAIADEAARQGLAANANNLASSMNYFLIKDGPQYFTFTDSPSVIIKELDQVVNGQAYVLLVPTEPSDNSLLLAIKEAVSQAKRIRRGEQGDRTERAESVIVGASFDCNYANSQCQSELAVNQNLPGRGVDHIQYYVSARTLQTSIYPFQVLGFTSRGDADRGLAVPALRQVQEQISGLTFDQAIIELSQKESEKEGTIKVFDLSFSGAAVFLALPIGVIVTFGWLLMSTRELAKLNFSLEELRNEAIELFYLDPFARYVIPCIVTIVPAGAMLLLIRAVPAKFTPFLVPWLVLASIIVLVVALLLLAKRRTIIRLLVFRQTTDEDPC